MKILITDSATLQNNNDLPLDVFDRFGEVTSYKNITRDELLKVVKEFDILLCNKTVIDSEIFEKAENLKYIGLFATGYNNIDISAAKSRHIPVCNAGSYSTNAVVQQVMAYILIHFTNVPRYNDYVHSGGWVNSYIFSPLVFPGDEICGKTLGIVGFGNIGKALKKAAEGLGMRVVVNTRTPVPDGVTEFVSLDKLLKTSDVVSIHCPLNSQSADMMSEENFNKMKDGAFFINTSRGGVVDETALYNALQSGKLSGAAIDVLKTEPMKPDCILKNAKNLIITPHTAWAPLTTRKRLLGIVSENIECFINGNPKNNVAF